MTNELTAAEQYARLKAERFDAFLDASFSDEALKGVDLFEVKVESGMVFKCRRLDETFMANTGSMPMALTEQIVMADSGKTDAGDAQATFNKMSPAEKRASIAAAAQMVRYVCVEPRLIIGDVNGHRNAISVDALTMEDFKDLAEWAQSGGGEAPGLKTFRRKRK